MIHSPRPLHRAALRAVLLAINLLIGWQNVRAEPPGTAQFFYQNGDSPIVFLGDSITQQQMYTTLVEAYVLTRFPAWNVTFRNVGWGGDASWMPKHGGLSTGLTRDVLPLYPSAITIAYGMNGASRSPDAYHLYLDSCATLVQACEARGARVALLTSTSKEGYTAGALGGNAYNLALQQNARGLAGVAQAQNVPYVDQFTPFLNAIETGRQAGVLGTAGEPRLALDGIHPTWAGHLLMAATILKGFHAPSLVSRVELDAGARQVVAAQNCRVKANFASDLTFTRADEALPWPIPAEAALAFRLPGFNPVDDLSRYDLKVSNLASGRYDIFVDDRKIGTFPADALETGVNLSQGAGPITGQALALLGKIQQKNATFYTRWRTVQLTWPQGAARTAELARLDASIAAQERAINALRQPVPHTWRIAPVPLAIVTPANGGVLPAAPSRATSTTGTLPGDIRVRAALLCFRYGDATTPAGFWNGTSWVPRTHNNAATLERPVRLASDTWSAALPTPAQGMVPGRYALKIVIYYTHQGAVASPWSVFTVLAPDRIGPLVSIAHPINGAVLRNLAALSGTAADNRGGSGIAEVQLEICRASDKQWWTGASWGTRTELPVIYKTNGTWSKATGLPAGTDLPDGAYTLFAIAVDRAGNRADSKITLRIDTLPPTVTFSTPLPGTFQATLNPISGTVDEVTGAPVQLTIQRNSDGLFWTGIDWGARTLLATGSSPGGTWNYSIPPNASLPDGLYTLEAIAKDVAGNLGQSSVQATLDATPPAITLSAPQDGAVLTNPNLGVLGGTVADNGSDVESVAIQLQRQSDGLFWTGTTWGDSTLLTANIGTNGTGTYSLSLDLSLQDGLYTLAAIAKDMVGNRGQSSVQVSVDTTPPSITLSAPADGTVLTSADLGTLGGTVADNGSGLDRVMIQIQRQSDGLFWTGTTWGDATDLAASFQDSSWSKNDELPSGADLADDGYQITVTATDKAGNSQAATSVFEVATNQGQD